MNIGRPPLAIITASLVVVFSLTGLAQAQPAPGPEGSPEGAWPELQGRLRIVHLSAHLETRALLNPDQVVRYEQLRGYCVRGSAAPNIVGSPSPDHNICY